MKKMIVCLLALFILAAVPTVRAAEEELLCFAAPPEKEMYLAPASSAETLEEILDVAQFAAYLREEFGKGTTMIDISHYQIPYSSENSNAIARFIWEEMPDCFHVELGGFWGYSSSIYTKLEVRYVYTSEEYAQMMAVWQTNVDALLSGIIDSAALTDVEKALLLHDRLAVLCEYDYERLQNGTMPDDSYDAYGVFVNETAVCQGYAEAYKYLLKQVGIESFLCSSEALNHAWNIVLIDGQYYHVDVTWDDPVWDIGGRVRHTNFLRSSEAFLQSHTAGDYDTTPTDTTYDTYFWQNSDAAFQLVNGVIYYIDSVNGTLNRYDGTELLSVDDTWSAGASSFWTKNYTRLASDGEDLYFSQTTAVYKYDLSAGAAQKVFEPAHTFGEYFSIFGFTYEDGTLVCEMSDTPNFTADTKKNYRVTGDADIPVVPDPQPTVVASGTCGENLTWTLTDDGTLTISGTGKMTEWNSTSAVPWDSHRSGIKQVVIENGVTSIGDYAFQDCSNLTGNFEIPESVTRIGNYAFQMCHGITGSLEIPSGVTTIGESAFNSCENLTGVTIPAGVEFVGATAFSYCNSLTAFTVNGGNTAYCAVDGALFTKDMETLLQYPVGKTAVSYVIPDGVASVALHAFSGNKTLVNITVPASTASIDSHAFLNCHSLVNITVNGENTAFCDVDGVLFTKNSPVLHTYPLGRTTAEYTVPSGTVSIGQFAFTNVSSLTSITLPDTLTTIGSRAFTCCHNLVSITIPDSVTFIASNAFTLCKKLTITGYTGSYAETFASENNIPFVSLGQAPVAEIASGTCGENLTWKLTTDGTLTISGTGKMTDFEDGVSAPWYAYNASIKKIVLENGVTSVGAFAFYPCSEVRQVSLPEGLKVIGHAAFFNCGSLTEITIPASVTSISEGPFAQCRSLLNIFVAEDNAYYCDEDGILFNKTKTELIRYPAAKTAAAYTVPEGVASIGYQAFRNAFDLTEVTLPESVVSIETCAFMNCTSLAKITIPASVISIGNDAFRNCPNLTITGYSGSAAEAYANANNVPFVSLGVAPLVTIASGTCGENLTWKLISDGTLTISGTGKMMDWNSTSAVPWYANRSAIIKVAIESGVTSIGSSAFIYCDNLASISIPASVTSIGSSAFFSCDNLASIIIPASVTSIGSSAFYFCTNLTSITIPASVTSIGSSAFFSCDNLASITVDSANANYCDINGVLFTKDTTTLIKYPAAKLDTSYVIPAGVTSVGSNAFLESTNLTSVTLPDGMLSIAGLAFQNCYNLTSITIPASVTSIGSGAFVRCRSMTAITVDAGNANYCDIDGVLFTKDKTTLHTYPAGKTANSYVIPAGVVSIGNNAFDNCTKLTSVTIPVSVTSIGNNAFYNCSNLTSITIPDSVISIGNSAFGYCSKLTSITIPDSVTSIGNSAFGYCSNLTSVTIPASVTSIGNYAFRGCSSLASVTVLNSDAVMGTDVFANCTALASITGYAGSTAENYAAANSIPFISLGHLPVSGVSLNRKSLYLAVGRSSVLTATVRPSAALNKSVVWSSSDETVATVSGGKVTALKIGTAVITATTAEGGFTASCKVTVSDTSVSDGQGQTASGEVLVGTPEIDGKVDGMYKNSLTIISGDYPMQVIAGHNEGWDMSMIATTYALYDDDYIYICSDVKDDDVVSPADSYMAGTNPYNMDGIEYRLRMTEGNTVKVSVDAFGKRCFGLAAHELLFDYSTIKYKTTVTDDGFVIELAIPREGIFAMPDEGPFGIKIQLADCTAEAAGTKPKEKTNFFSWLPTPDGSEGITTPVEYAVSTKVAAPTAIISTEAPAIAVQGSTFTYTVSLAGTYDGFAFELYPCDGMAITGITAASSNINVDNLGDPWLVSVLGGLDKTDAAKETVITVTAEVAADAAVGERKLTLANVMLSDDLGERVTNVQYEYAAVEFTDQIPGDVNGDRVFNYYDVAKLYAFYRQKVTLDPWVITDINGDGTFNYYDVSKLYAIFRGKATFG